MSVPRAVIIKVKEGLVPGIKTLYYKWSGEMPPDDLEKLEPLREDILPWINYTWWDKPAEGVPAEYFAIAWKGFIRVPHTGLYRFYVTTDDGSRVWIDDKLIIDAWKDQSPTTYVSEPIMLEAGYHRLKYYFYNRYKFAEAILGWIPPKGQAGVIPKEIYYYPISDTILFTDAPNGHIVEVLPAELPRKRCVSVHGICSVKTSFEEMPLKAIIRVLSPSGEIIHETGQPMLLWGGDEIKISIIG